MSAATKAPRRRVALQGRRGNFIWTPTSELVLVRDKDHFLYDPRVDEPLDPEFVESIERDGVLEPVLVWKATFGKRPGDNLIVAGRQRYRAVDEINTLALNNGSQRNMLVPAIAISTKGLTDEQAANKLFGIMVVENEKRRDDSALGKARKTQRYLDMCGDKVLVAQRFSITTKTVEARLKFLTMSPVVQGMVEEKKLGFWAATELSVLPIREQEHQAKQLAAPGSGGGGKKASIEDAKVAAGKGKARERSAVEKAQEKLLFWALKYAAKRDSKELPAMPVLKAAIAYHAAVEASK